MQKGKVYLVISAFIYGFTPVLAKIVYSGGTNGMTLTFLRAFLSLPLLLFVLLFRKIGLSISKRQFPKVLLLAIFGNAFSMIFLYAAYDFIPIGLATVLHYVYPLIIVLICRIFYKERMTRKKILATVLVMTGVFLFSDINSKGDIIGIVLAILSGLFYAFNVLYMDKSGLDRMHYLKLTFYISLIMSVFVFAFGMLQGELQFSMPVYAWLVAGGISVLITFCALPFFQLGVLYEGATTAGILSTIEPITGVLSGVIFLGEPLTFVGILGCVFILSGVVLIEKE